MKQKYITVSDGTMIPVPTDEPTYSLGTNGTGYVAVRANAEQVRDYYEAACNENVQVAWADYMEYTNNYETSDTVTRYDQAYDIDPLDKVNSDIPSQIKYIRERYEKDDPLVRGIIDVLTELTCGTVRLEGGSDALRRQILDWYANVIKVGSIIENISHEYWLSGNAIISVASKPFTKRSELPFVWNESPYDDANVILSLSEKLLNSGKEADDIILKVLRQRFGVKESDAAKKNRYTTTVIPTSYTIIDPLTLEPTGRPNRPDFLLRADSQMMKYAKDDVESQSLIAQYGQGFVDSLRENKRKARIDSDKLRTIYAKKPDYNYWGYVPGGSAIMYMQLKKRLGNLGLNTISQAISYIILIRLGSDKLPVKGTDQLKAVSKLWRDRSRKNTSAALVQPHTTQIDIISPPESSMQLLTANAYDNPNMQISQSYGVNLALITGIASNTVSYSFASMAIRPTIRRVLVAQNKIAGFLYLEHLAIGTALGYDIKDIPKASFIGTGLENASELASAFQNMYEHGFPAKYYLENLGVDYHSAIDQAILEREMGIDELFLMRGAPSSTSNTGRPPGIPQEQTTEDFPEKKQREAKDLNLQEVYLEIKENEKCLK